MLTIDRSGRDERGERRNVDKHEIIHRIRRDNSEKVIRRAFGKRTMEPTFEAIGHKFAPDAEKAEKIWIGFEVLVDSPYVNPQFRVPLGGTYS